LNTPSLDAVHGEIIQKRSKKVQLWVELNRWSDWGVDAKYMILECQSDNYLEDIKVVSFRTFAMRS
jgi:hypothetical protein